MKLLLYFVFLLPPSRGSFADGENFNGLSGLCPSSVIDLEGSSTWVWVKIKPPVDRRFFALFPFTRVPFWVPIFDPHPHEHLG